MDHSTRQITDQSAVAITATVNGTARLVESYTELVAIVDATAASGSPTLDVAIQCAPTDAGPWVTHSSFAQATGVTTLLKTASLIGQWVRLRYVYGGTGSITITSYLIFKS